MTAQPRIGVIGLGHAHGPMWARAFATNPDCELVGIYEHVPTRLPGLADELRVSRDSDLDRFLDRGLDAVAVTSEHALHRAHIEAAASAGLDILCEKPLVTTLADAGAIDHMVVQAGVRFMQGFQMRLDPANVAVRGSVRSGEIGRIGTVAKRHSHPLALRGWPDDGGEWFWEPKLSGGGAGLDEMIHSCDWLRWIFGEPEEVTAMWSMAMAGGAVEDQIVATFRMRSGALATLSSGWTDIAGTVTTQISGDQGAIIELYTDLGSVSSGRPFDASVLRYRTDEGWTPLEPAHSFPHVHDVVANEFVRCLRTGEPFPSDLADGKAALAMVLAAYESAKTGTVVRLGAQA